MTGVFHVAIVSWLLLGGANPLQAENPDLPALLQKVRAEYRSGHFTDSETLFLAAPSTIEQSDPAERAATLTALGDVYLNEDEMSKAERAYADSLAMCTFEVLDIMFVKSAWGGSATLLAGML